MANTVIDTIDEAFESFEPRPTYDIYKVEERKPNKVTHKLKGY